MAPEGAETARAVPREESLRIRRAAAQERDPVQGDARRDERLARRDEGRAAEPRPLVYHQELRVHGIELDKRCQRYSAFACKELADDYTRGDGVDRDMAAALRYRQKACFS